MSRSTFLLLLPLVLAPATARAQASCDIQSGANTKLVQLNTNTPAEQIFIGGGATFVCSDGKVIRSDSAIIIKATEQRLLIGHASYSDREKTLTGAQIFYWGREQHLTAQTGVVLTDKVNGAIIRGEYLDYYLPRQGQPESRAVVYGGRPHAILQPRRGQPATAPAAGAPAAPPDTAVTLVDAERMEIAGQKTFHAVGNVVITRADMHGTSQEAFYDPDADHLRMTGGAKVTGSDYALAGESIDGTMAGNQFKTVTATSHAVLDSKDLRVKAPALTVAFDSGRVQRLIALSAERGKQTATEGKTLAEAFARDFHLLADSIDAVAPGQKIERVTAVGHAYGERQNDSIKVKLPEVASRDWLRGDTITGFFADAKPKAGGKGSTASGRNGRKGQDSSPKVAGKPSAAPADTAERVLERIVAVGDGSTPASSMYRILDQKKPSGIPAISYLLAKRIVVAFRDGEVHEVSAEGEIRGMHLEPQEPPKKAAPAKKNVAEAAPAARSVRR